MNSGIILLRNHSPSLPQPSAGQSGKIRCHSPAPVVGLGAQARLNQDEHWPQQQLSPNSDLQSLASKSLQGLPGEARLHSDKRPMD